MLIQQKNVKLVYGLENKIEFFWDINQIKET